MKLIFFRNFVVLLTFLPLVTWGKEFEVIDRKENYKMIKRSVDLKNLISQSHFEGKHFKIVLKKSNQAISFDHQDDLMKLRAATVYYHLTKARDYFVYKLNSSYVKNLSQLTIRLDMTNEFNVLGHFANDAKDPLYNNAKSVPGGDSWVEKGVKAWGPEIWFRPPLETHFKEIEGASLLSKEYEEMIKQARKSIHMVNLQRFLAFYIGAEIKGLPFPVDNIMRTAGTSVLTELLYQFYNPLSEAFSRKYFSMDTALIPEVVYHEFVHLALSDYLPPDASTAVIEGLADYFATQISGHKKIAKRIKRFNTFAGKRADNKKVYRVQFETEDFANSDFVLGLLWSFDHNFPHLDTPYYFYEMRKDLYTYSSIRVDLVEAILSQLERSESSRPGDFIKINSFLHFKGI